MTNPELTQKRPSLKELLASGDLISPVELAAALKVARVTVYQWVRRGVIPHLKLEGCVRFDPQEVQAWLESKRRAAFSDSGPIPPQVRKRRRNRVGERAKKRGGPPDYISESTV
jgi:excisionase family DNA binding protein